MKKITLPLFSSFSTSIYALENNKLKKISSIKNHLLLITIALLTTFMNAQGITYTMTSNIHGSTDLTNVTELNDDDSNTYKKIRAVNSILNIDTTNDTQLISYSLKASNHTNILFDSGMTENATGTESIGIGSGLVGNSVIVGGSKNTLKAPLTGQGIVLNEFTFSSLIKIASGTTGTVNLLSLETASGYIIIDYDITNQTFNCDNNGVTLTPKALTILADTQYQISFLFHSDKIQLWLDQVKKGTWAVSGGIPADPIENAYLGYNSSTSTAGSLIEYDGSYFFNEKLFANNQSQIHDDAKILNKVPVAGSDFDFGARNWGLYGLVDAVDEFDNPIINKILIDEQTNQSFTSGEQKDFNVAPGNAYQEYELRFKGFAMSELKLNGTTLSVDKFSKSDFSILKDHDRIILECDKYFSYKIYDITGRLIKNQPQKTQSSSIQLTKSQVYILKMQVENQVITKKFIL